jgi:hypothetical protein
VSSYDKVSVVTLSKYGNQSILSSGRKDKRTLKDTLAYNKGQQSKRKRTNAVINASHASNPEKIVRTERFNLPFKECYPNVPTEIYDTYEIKRSLPKIALKNRVRQLTTARAILCFLKNGYKVFVCRSNGQVYPCLYEIGGRLLKYGEKYPMAIVCADAGLTHSDRSHVPIGIAENSGNIVILSKKYKQNPLKIDALLAALESYYNSRCSNLTEGCNKDLGEFGGNITIFGSGGSNTVLGSFAPTTKCTKDDPHVVIGLGQTRMCPVNHKLDQLAIQNSVQAIFLNEYSYRNIKTTNSQEKFTLTFLGYYKMMESRFVNGDNHEKIQEEFSNPTDSDWQYLTFRLHPHLCIEAMPLFASFDEVSRLLTADSIDYKKIVLDHDDDSNIFYECAPEARSVKGFGWMAYNHRIGIEDVIEQMIKNGEINKYVVGQTDTTNDNDEHHSDSKSDSDTNFESDSDSDCDSDDHSTTETDSTDSDDDNVIQIIVGATKKESGSNDCDSDSEYEYDSNSNNDEDDMELLGSAHAQSMVKNGKPKKTKTTGTGVSITDVICCCMFNSAACAMRYNQKSLQQLRKKMCAAPLIDKSLGITLRTRPTPSSNRAFDVVSCYLRHALQDHPELLPSILSKTRCAVSDIGNDTLTDIMFQIILLRFTGRVYRYEGYHGQEKLNSDPSSTNHHRIPCRGSVDRFLDYVQLDLEQNDTSTLNRWVSKQHDGAISSQLRKNFGAFKRFVEYISRNLQFTLDKMRLVPNSMEQRSHCVCELEDLLIHAMSHGGITKVGNSRWMSYVIVSDVEEFVVDPFGKVEASSVVEGNYSRKGHEMINQLEGVQRPFKVSLEKIVSCVKSNVAPEYLEVMGYEKK